MEDQIDSLAVPATHPAQKEHEGKGTSGSGVDLRPEMYKFTHRRRGRAVILNNRHFNQTLTGQRERDGTDVDASALESLFMMMGFEVTRYDNLTTLDMSVNMREIAGEDHSDADCFVCVILSHGEEGVVYGTNGTIKLDKIYTMFKGDDCPTLVGKPKIFFIQACRGRRYDWGVDRPSADEDSTDAAAVSEAKKIPVEADFLMAYSVSPGYFSWRNNVDGSWFVQALVRVFKEYIDQLDLLSMLTLVNRHVAEDFQSCTDSEFTTDMKQMPSLVSTLTRTVFFKQK